MAYANFEVKQINKQLNATLDTNTITNTQTQIESLKTIINSLKNTISQQKAKLVELIDVGDRADLNAKINANINDLSKKTTEYYSLVRSLSTMAYENSAVNTDPKYRIRGFFPIPEPKGNPPQHIIQFEYAYRYLKLDNTGNELDTYEMIDPSSGQKMKGTFTDWNIITGPLRERYYDSSTRTYKWNTENIGDGDINNINQIDIPITKGEKVEIKIRSISEAGWPLNPLKSEWSNSVVIDFPANLQTTNQIINILNDAQVEEETIKLEETLASSGVNTHIQDSIPNPASGSGTYFKHQSANLSVDIKQKNVDNNLSEINTTDLQSHLETLSSNTYITISRPSGSSSAYLSATGTLQQLFQAIVDSSAAIYDNFVSYITE